MSQYEARIILTFLAKNADNQVEIWCDTKNCAGAHNGEYPFEKI